MLEGLEPPQPKSRSRIDEILAELDAKDKKILLDAIDNPNWSANGLSIALKSRGLKLSSSSIHRYRENKKLAN
jgi:hypothetical protein